MERTEFEARSGGNNDLKDVASAKIEDARQWSAQLLDRAESFIRERPGTAVLAAVGAGFIIGRLIRRV